MPELANMNNHCQQILFFLLAGFLVDVRALCDALVFLFPSVAGDIFLEKCIITYNTKIKNKIPLLMLLFQ